MPLLDRRGLDPASVDRPIQTTTLFTNALIERKHEICVGCTPVDHLFGQR